jgi:hypothetical protein
MTAQTAELPFPAELDAVQDIASEYLAMLQFIHLAPVGLVQTASNGDIQMMNPKAAQLLAPLGFGEGEPNLFDILDKASSDVRALAQVFAGSTGVVCENYRLVLPTVEDDGDGDGDGDGDQDAPEALGLTILMLTNSPASLMAVITDETNALKLQRLQSTWMR